MGFLDNVFTEEEFDDYRYLEKYIINEAEDDEQDDPEESNFDMPDDDEGGGETPTSDQGSATGPDGQELSSDNPEESNFDMPDDGGGEGDTPEPAQQDAPAPAAEDPGQPAPANEPTPDQGGDDLGDDPEESNFDLPDDAPEPDNAEDNPEAGADGGGEGDNPDEANFDMPDDGGEGGDTGTTDGGTTDTGTDDTSADSGGPDPDQNIKDAEGEIFANLSDKDKINKVNELKTLYEDLYNRIVTLYDKINEIPKDDELIKVYNFITDNLADMKEYVYDYMTSTFDNKTYLENMINYKKYLSTLNVINGILEEIRKGLYKADK